MNKKNWILDENSALGILIRPFIYIIIYYLLFHYILGIINYYDIRLDRVMSVGFAMFNEWIWQISIRTNYER